MRARPTRSSRGHRTHGAFPGCCGDRAGGAPGRVWKAVPFSSYGLPLSGQGPAATSGPGRRQWTRRRGAPGPPPRPGLPFPPSPGPRVPRAPAPTCAGGRALSRAPLGAAGGSRAARAARAQAARAPARERRMRGSRARRGEPTRPAAAPEPEPEPGSAALRGRAARELRRRAGGEPSPTPPGATRSPAEPHGADVAAAAAAPRAACERCATRCPAPPDRPRLGSRCATAGPAAVPAPGPAMWTPTEEEKYGVGRCGSAGRRGAGGAPCARPRLGSRPRAPGPARRFARPGRGGGAGAGRGGGTWPRARGGRQGALAARPRQVRRSGRGAGRARGRPGYGCGARAVFTREAGSWKWVFSAPEPNLSLKEFAHRGVEPRVRGLERYTTRMRGTDIIFQLTALRTWDFRCLVRLDRFLPSV